MGVTLLTFTTLYPDTTRPTHGIFVENRLRHLLASGEARARVVAPVPWFPFSHRMFGEYGNYARVPRREIRHEISVEHPRYPLLPKLGMSTAPFLMAAAARRDIRRVINDGHGLNLIDAHYFYPDGVASVLLGRVFSRPVVITARGSDINLIPRYRLPRRMIQWAARQASALVTVSSALKESLVNLGVPAGKITVLRNGVELDLFKPPRDRETIRGKLRAHGRTLLSVGNLIPSKGHDVVVHALSELPGTHLWIAGGGPEEPRLRKLIRKLDLESRVRLLGTVPHGDLPEYYGAADVLVLMSEREGWPNVLLEALACGTPVIAKRTGGTPEIVGASEAGVLLEDNSPLALASALDRLFRHYPDRADTRRYAEQFSWDSTTEGQLALFSRIAADARGAWETSH